MNTIKVSTEISKIYMDIQHPGSSLIGPLAPPELASLQKIIPEKLHIWQLGEQGYWNSFSDVYMSIVK